MGLLIPRSRVQVPLETTQVSIAQSVERWPFKPVVTGSSPVRDTHKSGNPVAISIIMRIHKTSKSNFAISVVYSFFSSGISNVFILLLLAHKLFSVFEQVVNKCQYHDYKKDIFYIHDESGRPTIEGIVLWFTPYCTDTSTLG